MGCGSSKDTNIRSIQDIQKSQRLNQKKIQKASEKYANYKEIKDFIGIQHDLPLEILIDLGFKIIFDELYSQETSLEDLLTVRYQCQKETMICIGGINCNYSKDILQLCCIDEAFSIFSFTKNTDKAKETSNKNYFYMQDKFSFGFAPNEDIMLDCADQYDRNNNERLSWLLNGVGGGRLGNQWAALEEANNYRKIILIYGGQACY